MHRPFKIVIRSLLILLVAGYGLLLLFNGAPKPPPAPVPSAGDEMKSPFVVKIHARWCPVCMATKPSWTKLQKSFRERVRFVVFDVTSGSSKAASHAEAVRLGLGEFFEAYSGRLGSVFVLNGDSKEVLASLDGLHGYAAYAGSIEEALNSPAATARK
jgi:thiol-disulfide isomerase/thioredoxin